MISPKSLPTLLFGAALGISLVLACGDDDHPAIDAAHAADAAACNCPAAEPPIAGRIVVRENSDTIPANSESTVAAGCLTNEVLLGGGCHIAAIDLVLRNSQVNDTGDWECLWASTNPLPQTGTAQAICLTPP